MPFPKPGGGSGLDQLTGDVTAGPGTGAQAATLEATANVESVIAANTTVAGAIQGTATPGGDLAGTGSTYTTPELIAVGTAGTVGDASHYPVVTTDAKGRVTGMVATAVPAGTPATTVTGPDAFGATAIVGTSTLYAREDHDHGLPAAPAVPAPATTVTGPDTFGAAAVVGTGTTYARVDHDHGLPAAPADIPLSTVTAAGDLIVGSGAGTVSRLGIGANGDVLTVAAGALSYSAPVATLATYTASLGSIAVPGTDVATTLATFTLPVGTFLLNASLGVYSSATTTTTYSITMAGVVGTAVGSYAPVTTGQFAQASLRDGAVSGEVIMLSGSQIITITTGGTFLIQALSNGAVTTNNPQSTATLIKIG